MTLPISGLLLSLAAVTVHAVRLESSPTPFTSGGLEQLRLSLGIPHNVTLRYSSNVITLHSTVLVRFQPMVNDIEVYGGIVTAEFDRFGSFNGNWSGFGANVSVTDDGVPRVTARRAFAALASAFRICKRRRDSQYSLKYYIDPSSGSVRLIYRLSYFYEGNDTVDMMQPTGLIDALTAQPILYWNGYTTQSVSSIAAIGGNMGKAGVRTYDDLNVTRLPNGACVYSTPDVQVQNMMSTTVRTFSPTSFTCSQANSPNYDLVNGGYSALNDVARNCEITVKMYREYVNVNGPLNAVPIKARVHFGSDTANANWDGTYANFGDGGSALYPLTSLDVVAHEFGHGFTGTSDNSRLEYYGESGGISEAFADMSGQAAVYFNSGANDFKPGSKISKLTDALRYMCNPSQDGVSIDHYSRYIKGMDVHYSSGLYNKVFCLLASLGGDWDVPTAFQMFASANSKYWSQWTDFNSGVCGVLRSVQRLMPSENLALATNAFRSVGLSCPSA